MARFVSLFRFLAIAILSLLFVSTASSQITNVTDDTSTPIPGVGHDYIKMLSETVNPANGSVSLRIGVSVPPGRRLTIPFSFAYDSNGVHHPSVSIGGKATWASNAGYLSQGGWTYTVPQLSFSFGTKTYGKYTCPFYTGYVFQDPSGTRHSLRLAYTPTLTGCPGGSIFPAHDDFYQATIPGSLLIADAAGTVYTFGRNTGCGWEGTSVYTELPYSTVEDRNGNRTTFVGSPTQCDGSFTVTDTMGRTVISSSGFGSTGNTLTVSGLNPFSLSWGSASANYGVGYTALGYNPACNGFAQVQQTESVVSQLKLPNGESYNFYYDSTYGLLNKIVYPTGGYVSYSWTLNPGSEAASFADANGNNNTCLYTYDNYAVAHRYVSFDGSTTALQQDFNYSTTWSTTSIGEWTTKSATVTTHDLVRGTSVTTSYTYTPVAVGTPPFLYDRFAAQIPVEASVVYNDTTGVTIETVNKAWNDQFELASMQTTLGSLSSQVNYSYGSGSVVTEKDEYDFGQTVPSRKTVTNYQTFAATPIYSSSASIFDQPCQTIVYDGSGNRYAETDYFYDNGATGTVCGTAGTPSVTGVSNLVSGTHDETNYGSSATAPRGNLTQKTQWSSTGTSPVTTYTYDETGQRLSKTDPCGNATCSDMTTGSHTTTYSYADSYTILSGGQNVSYTPTGTTNAYLTKITDPLNHAASFTYDFNNGQLTKSTDANSQNTTYIYNDPYARPTQATFPDGGQATYSYNDSPYNPTTPSPSVTTTQAITSSLNKVGTAAFDGMGHTVETLLSSDPDGTTYNATKFDGNARPYQVYNPTRCNPPTTNCGTETTWGITTHTYDALGRTTQVTEPDGSIVSTSYSGNQTTTTDETGNQRTSQSDSLGRLTAVWEAPNNTGYNYETQYQYDALNDLICTVQKGTDTTTFTTCASASPNWRPRSFQYDSLSRLTSATNPESGTITYTYDANRNLSSKVAPKPGQPGTLKVTTNYSYDILNRLTQKSYAGLSTSTVKFAYDGSTSLTACGQNPPHITSPTNLVGRRSQMCAEKSGSSWSYDSMGRPLIDSRINAGGGNQTQYSVGYSYDLDGSLNTLTYPSGNVITYTIGGAGRYLSAGDTTNTYASSATYAPHGAVAGMGRGSYNSVVLSTTNFYNDRLQPILLSAASQVVDPIMPPVVFLSLCYDFHLGVPVNSTPCQFNSYNTGDNGNVFQVTNNIDNTRSTIFAYDSLNRISQANTTNTTSSNCWGEVYTIDPWGNLYNRAGVSGMGTCFAEGLSAIATTQNQLSGIGVLYDAAGNVTNDGNGNTPTYDAENRIATDAGVTYYYDADGARMEKSSGIKYWFGPGGEVLTETSLGGTINAEYAYFNGERIARIDRPSGVVNHYFSDHLGSASVIINASGSELYYYYPYGGIESSSGSDTNHYKFTGKERDSESGLDNFGARYNTSTMGRFMTPDPGGLFKHLIDPQGLNRYGYTRNNPLMYIDPDGKDWETAWRDLKSFANTLYTKATFGFGAGTIDKVGPGRIKLEASYTGAIKFQTAEEGGVTLSRTAEIKASAEPAGGGAEAGIGVGVSRVDARFKSFNDVTGPEPWKDESIGSPTASSASLDASKEEIGLDFTECAGVCGGLGFGATREGWAALGDAISNVKDEIILPTAPPPPSIPGPSVPLAPGACAPKDRGISCNL